MPPRIEVHLTHATGTVDISLDGTRLVVKTKGTGLADELRVIDVDVSQIEHFWIVETAPVQNLSGTRAAAVVDTSRDGELLFTWREGSKRGKKRLFVRRGDDAMRALVARLTELRPGANLEGVPSDQAFQKLGMLSPRQGLLVVLAVLVGLPVVAAVAWAAITALR